MDDDDGAGGGDDENNENDGDEKEDSTKNPEKSSENQVKYKLFGFLNFRSDFVHRILL
jgi:hypothetical protein